MPNRSPQQVKPARLALALGLGALSGAVAGLALAGQAPVAVAEAALLLLAQAMLARHLLHGVAVATCRSCGAASPERLPDGSCVRCGDRRPAVLARPQA
jgi:hypothetical protein